VVGEHLKDDGRFFVITLNPALKPMKEFEYGRRFYNVNGKDTFEDGDQVKYEGSKSFDFLSYYYSKDTYEDCLRKAGFKTIKWIDMKVSKEGIEIFGDKYCDKLKTNSSPICLLCTKN
ncbi:MAG: hypothetical protein AABW87_00195, partial [Nanoarchaeota archaeon]